VPVLFWYGLHVPLTPLLELVGNAGAVVFWQNGPSCVNTGITAALTVTVTEAVLKQPLAVVTMTV